MQRLLTGALGALLALLLGSCSERSASYAAAAPPAYCRLGINLAHLAYYSPEYPFTDAFKLSQPFIHQSTTQWAVDEPLKLRDDGYPAELAPGHIAGTLIFRDIGTNYPAGRYVCLYDGKGRIEFDFAAAASAHSPGRIDVLVTPKESGIYLKITATDPADPIRNIRLLLPGCEEEQVFHPDFLRRWRGFAVVRFMDWQRINDSEVTTWDDRTLLSDQTQASQRGIAPEYMVQLCNELGADPWVCIPHRADDGYVTELAKLFAAELAPERKVWVEYSNETWNDQFTQADWCRNRGTELGLDGDPSTAQIFYHAYRAGEVHTIWTEQFGGRDRLVRVLAAQSANPWTSEAMLDWRDAAANADVLAIAPYFGLEIVGMEVGQAIASLTVPQILERCQTSVEQTLVHAGEHLQNANGYGLRLVAYEAGQHLVGSVGAENIEELTERLHAANRDPGMGEIYDGYLAGWRALGGSLLCAYHSTGGYSKWGSWGHCEDYGPDSEEAPKYRALRSFLASLEE
ncbi:MAG: hypothetical protein AAF628_04885 [Planctomycetota bacterium]